MDHALPNMLKPVLYVVASAYMLVDALFLTVAKPLSDWLSKRRLFDRMRAWIISLRPYPTLALFAVPVIILEPVKPASAYLVATGHVAAGIAVLAIGEVLKLVLLERLFDLSKNKLMSIPAFAWAYNKYQSAWNWLRETEAWQTVVSLSRSVRLAVYNFVRDLRSAHQPPRQISQH